MLAIKRLVFNDSVIMLEKVAFDYSIPKTLLVKLGGDWQISAGLLPITEITAQLTSHPDITQINLSVSQELQWDSGLIAFLLKLVRECEQKNIQVDHKNLPQGAQKLLELALKVHEKNILPQETRESFFEKAGERVFQIYKSLCSVLDFLGDITVSFGRVITGKAYFRWDDFMLIVQRCGVDTLMLVCLISLLVGMILAFVGSIQLKIFGAQIFVADIVGIAMVRVLAAVMTGIILAGRIGASFAAELGMMESSEEIDALKTLGVSPVEFLVIPRVLALVMMMPILTIYADMMGILGGFIISVGMLKLNPIEYLNHTQAAVQLSFVWVGLIHSIVFGVIVSVSGCLRGINCERNAAGVGMATTSAVVTGITGIVIATAIITFICQILGV
ncbi:MAG: ABC transporter permease [Candidatus Omnitrophica bacterium]|nr:ABC transporter permease [Candidatus Omnitrophota bacterium]